MENQYVELSSMVDQSQPSQAMPSSRIPGSMELAYRKRYGYRLVTMAAALGFGQGVGVSFFLAAVGYFGHMFDDPNFFVFMMATVYIPPIVVYVMQRSWDNHYDKQYGVRAAMACRVTCSGMLLFGSLLFVPALKSRVSVIIVGMVLGWTSGVLLSSTAQIFAPAPEILSWIWAGQSVGGIMAAVTQRLVGFDPGSARYICEVYYISAAIAVLLSTLLFVVCHWCGYLDWMYRAREIVQCISHDRPIEASTRLQRSSTAGLLEDVSSSSLHQEDCPQLDQGDCTAAPATLNSNALPSVPSDAESHPSLCEVPTPRRAKKGFFTNLLTRQRELPLLAPPIQNGRASPVSEAPEEQDQQTKSREACLFSLFPLSATSTLTLTFVITALSNDLAHADYMLGEALFIAKLGGDFGGRFGFALLNDSMNRCISCLRSQTKIVYGLVLVRVPFGLWLLSGLWRPLAPPGDDVARIVLFSVWVSFVATGAFAGSWVLTLAAQVAVDNASAAARKMTVSMYAGQSLGLLLATGLSFFSPV